MLPERYFPHDERWIKEQLAQLPAHFRAVAVKMYAEVYLEVYSATEKPHQKHGEARREANTRLRKYIERVLSAR